IPLAFCSVASRGAAVEVADGVRERLARLRQSAPHCERGRARDSRRKVVLESEAAVAGDRAEHRPLAIVADDEAEVRQLVSEVLAEVGFDTLSARDGVELV